jgi:hypothetical protein
MILNESPKDSLGRPLAEGDGVILTLNGPILFRVARIESSLDPRIPQGMMTIHLFSTASFQVKAGASHREFVRVGTVEELGLMPFEMSGLAPPAKETP